MSKSKKKRDGKTQELPAMTGAGVEKKEIPEIEKQAEIRTEAYKAWKKAGEKHQAEAVKLLELMDKHELEAYRLNDSRMVYVEDVRKAKIRSSDADEE